MAARRWTCPASSTTPTRPTMPPSMNALRSEAMDQTLITRIVEAALLAANQPLTVVQLKGLFPLDEPAPEGSVEQALSALAGACAERGVELVELASGWRYQVKAEVHA